MIMAFCKGILNFLENKTEKDFKINQQHAGMEEAFQGHAMKEQQGANFEYGKYFALNKIITMHCVLHYN